MSTTNVKNEWLNENRCKGKKISGERKIYIEREINLEREMNIKGEDKMVKEIETKQKDRISKFSLKNGTL